MEHSFHKLIGNIVDESNLSSHGYKILKDRACGGSHRLPLFCLNQGKKSRRTQYCNVDMLLLKDDKIKVIVEIEESDVKPTQICGKFLASALSTHYVYKPEDKKEKQMAESVLFLQVLDSSKLVEAKSSKGNQWDNLKKSIKNIIPIRGSNIVKYDLLYWNPSNFERNGTKRNRLADWMHEFLKK